MPVIGMRAGIPWLGAGGLSDEVFLMLIDPPLIAIAIGMLFLIGAALWDRGRGQ